MTDTTVSLPTVLSLASMTLATSGGLKASLADAATALDGSVLTIALRDNGPKVNGTLVLVDGKVGEIGDAFNAKNAGNGRPYGPHLVLGTVEYHIEAGEVKFGAVTAEIDVDVATFRAPVFQ